jgi:hypothetical protein
VPTTKKCIWSRKVLNSCARPYRRSSRGKTSWREQSSREPSHPLRKFRRPGTWKPLPKSSSDNQNRGTRGSSRHFVAIKFLSDFLTQDCSLIRIPADALKRYRETMDEFHTTGICTTARTQFLPSVSDLLLIAVGGRGLSRRSHLTSPGFCVQYTLWRVSYGAK